MVYGARLDNVAEKLGEHFTGSDDPTQDLLVYLALAYHSLKRMSDLGVVSEIKGRPLVKSRIEKAYREALHVRQQTNESWMREDFISRLGRIVDASKVRDLFW